jgi:hypothetical protein
LFVGLERVVEVDEDATLRTPGRSERVNNRYTVALSNNAITTETNDLMQIRISLPGILS